MAAEYYALITGAGRGIGRAMANEMASRGHNLILTSLPDEGLDSLCTSLIERYNIKARHFEIDLTTPEGPLTLFRATKDNALDVNIVVNNAGIGFEGPIESYSRHMIDTMILLNIRAMTLITYYFTPELKKRSSYLLNISSYGCYAPTAFKSVYLATKSYIYYLTRALESEFAGTSVRTCLLIPAGVRTNDLVKTRMKQGKRLARATVLEPEEVAYIAINGMFKGEKIIIPGRLVRFLFAISVMIPEGIVFAATRKMFRREDSL
jgi:short-subunit dehydrogenase